MTLLARLNHLLTQVRDRAADDFSGVGLVVYYNIRDIPAFPMAQAPSALTDKPAMDAILGLSSARNPHHDGFHLLNSNMEVTHSCQYLAPPIDAQVKLSDSDSAGARYMTALFVSMIPSVAVAGIVSTDKRIQLFERGRVTLGGLP